MISSISKEAINIEGSHRSHREIHVITSGGNARRPFYHIEPDIAAMHSKK